MTKLPDALQKLADTPAVNPRYKGATPNDLARALLRKRTPPAQDEPTEPPPRVKPAV